MKNKTTFINNNAPAATAEMPIQEITCNLLPKLCRHETLEGKNYIAVPMIILTEGVHNGSQGPLYYPPDELGKTPAAWNYKPVVVYHPELNGQSVSACDATIIESRKIGVMMNTRYENGKLKSEAWIDREKADKVDSRIMQAVDNGEMMELSTGVFVDEDPIPGEWKGETYNSIARNYRPDHLALLPDRIGACSIADGAGFLRNQDGSSKQKAVSNFQKLLRLIGLADNEMSFGNIRAQLGNALSRRFTEDVFLFVEDVYSNFFIFEKDGKLFRLGYSTTDNDVVLSDDEPVEVKRVTEYRTINGDFVGNHQPETHNNDMNKKQLVDAIIANKSGWSENDRNALMAFTENQLKTIQNAIAPADGDGNHGSSQQQNKDDGNVPAGDTTANNQGNQNTKNEPAPAGNNQQQQNNTPPPKKDEPVTMDEYINRAPKPIQDVLKNSLSVYNQEKQRLIDSILSNEKNSFTKEQLEARDLDEVRAIANLAGVKQESARNINYGGQAPVPAGNDQEEALELPVMEFSK